MYDSKRLGEILVDLGLLEAHDVDRILDALDRRYDHRKFGQTAQDMGLVSEEHILAALAVQMELFPGIEDLTLQEILNVLLTPSTEAAHSSGAYTAVR